MAHGYLADQKDAGQVNVDHAPPLLIGHQFKGGIVEDTGVVNQNVEPPQLCHRTGNHRLDIRPTDDIGGEGGRAHAMSLPPFFTRLRRLLYARQVQIRERQPTTLLGKTQGNSAPNAARRPRNHCHFTAQPRHILHSSSVSCSFRRSAAECRAQRAPDAPRPKPIATSKRLENHRQLSQATHRDGSPPVQLYWW